MYSDYDLFGSPSLPQLALDQNMIQNLDEMTKSRKKGIYDAMQSRVHTSRLGGQQAHVRAIANPESLTNYGNRKEVTFRLDTILKMWRDGYFDPGRKPHVGPLSRTVPLSPGLDEHFPFWIVPTNDLNALIFTQAARLIVPLDHLFQGATVPSTHEGHGGDNRAECSIRRIFAFYTAQLLCRLLQHNFSSEPEVQFDNWIWRSTWTVSGGASVFKELKGLGLESPIEESGMLWISPALMDWRKGHLAPATLIELYIPRSPLQVSTCITGKHPSLDHDPTHSEVLAAGVDPGCSTSISQRTAQ
ncbi:hypothetical protein MGU_10545 [Metarhizium guizhouense ARSEF 977]|uniref:Uncharacterized protein n=1 Tax=Metarhizium guizhouense (strain ARSEF 977) TaxID=1276136 RepID=A0A0B4HRM4_METGA|nr:hypothetical protein MGU_10545 [Metarhizium guizhouense ARSEF 977]